MCDILYLLRVAGLVFESWQTQPLAAAPSHLDNYTPGRFPNSGRAPRTPRSQPGHRLWETHLGRHLGHRPCAGPHAATGHRGGPGAPP
ncbi:hypothetical protein PCANC_27558 [Puccinia coronata f. sp. avenae]|uniref:Uncharacterized protein n=1 Tax=Puccinia coronata f. sp. avenae TaxID=200324 RepID=A0A2N5TQX5_9BASI|nr:hypothetical protein PCANC_27558 [Puccinia coronata f. sp. avenae]